MYIISQDGWNVIKLTGGTVAKGDSIGYMVYHVDASGQYMFWLGTYKTEEEAFEAMAGLIEAVECGYRSFRMPEEESR